MGRFRTTNCTPAPKIATHEGVLQRAGTLLRALLSTAAASSHGRDALHSAPSQEVMLDTSPFVSSVLQAVRAPCPPTYAACPPELNASSALRVFSGARVALLFAGEMFRSGKGHQWTGNVHLQAERPCNVTMAGAQRAASNSYKRRVIQHLELAGARVDVLFTFPDCAYSKSNADSSNVD